MNVFKKISCSNIFMTQKKKTSLSVPESAIKLDIDPSNCYFLTDYEIRGDGILLCRIIKDYKVPSHTNLKTINCDVKQCIVKEKIDMKNLWIGKKYHFVNLTSLRLNTEQETDNQGTDFVADKILLITKGNVRPTPYKSKHN